MRWVPSPTHQPYPPQYLHSPGPLVPPLAPSRMRRPARAYLSLSRVPCEVNPLDRGSCLHAPPHPALANHAPFLVCVTQSTKLGKAQAHRRRVNALRRRLAEVELAATNAEEGFEQVPAPATSPSPLPPLCGARRALPRARHPRLRGCVCIPQRRASPCHRVTILPLAPTHPIAHTPPPPPLPRHHHITPISHHHYHLLITNTFTFTTNTNTSTTNCITTTATATATAVPPSCFHHHPPPLPPFSTCVAPPPSRSAVRWTRPR